MFPFCTHLPKHAESWLVNLVDKTVGAHEFGQKYKQSIKTNLLYLSNVIVFLLFKKI